ncbi:MAG: aminotransferase class I/II-fold pyridoxal phosphate-dependent enzyme [Bacteroidia bacterium]|nr:aminotransferase class I/II-fold pyridoxal phosphate-dependent enzyme [Bacteroidia bacterium]
MNIEEYRAWAHKLVDWTADYYENLESYPVKSQVSPGEIFAQLPNQAPSEPEEMARIFEDFQNIILPGITHWQHPGFMAYFPANTSYPSLLAEMLTSAMGAQCMVWDTSPAAAELEEKMMNWLKTLIGIPDSWDGVIQSTASEATLCAILSARERITDFTVNERGLQGHPHFRVYASEQIHSSIEKGVKIAGLGRENYVPVATDKEFAMRPDALEAAIKQDMAQGNTPLCIVAGLGTTGSTAIDPLAEIARIASKYQIWLHVDAAYAGSALILPEFQHLLDDIGHCDSFVFNPHKWLMTNFDCSAYFVKDKGALIRTFEILPEYLKTSQDQQVNNYRDWGIPLGRRFRALKLWFVMRSFGVQGMQDILRNHIHWAQDLATQIEQHPDYELLAPTPFNLICFRYCPSQLPPDRWNALNKAIIERIKKSGKFYLTHTMLRGQYTMRLVAGQPYQTQHNLLSAWELVQQTATHCLSESLSS